MIPLVDLSTDKKTLAQIKFAINEVLNSGSFILGENLLAFEKSYASYIGVSNAVGVGNGTDALRLGLRALGVGKGDKVLTVAFTSPFTSLAIVEEGAIPVYCDIDEMTWTMSVEDAAKKYDKKVKAIMPVHIYGNPADMINIMKFAKANNLFVVEDASQAHGSSILGKKIGSFGDVGGFSFYPTKNLGALGDAGMITTNSKKLASIARTLRHGGQTKRFWHELVGVNSRLDELQAAILNVKIKYLDRDHKLREKIVKKYKKEFLDLPITFQDSVGDAKSAFHLCVVRVKGSGNLQKFLAGKGIASDIYYPYPVHKQPAFSKYAKGKLPVTDLITSELLAIPLFPSLSSNDQDFVIENIRKYFKK